MKMAAFKAHCPYEIGDEIKTRRRISPEEAEAFHLDPETVVEEVHTITDIVCVHSVKNMAVGFLFELDGDTKKVGASCRLLLTEMAYRRTEKKC